MKRFWLGVIALFGLAGSVQAQTGQACLSCDQGNQRYVYRKCCPPEDQADQQGTEPEGMFVAPGPTGDVSGEANSIGLRLGRIHVPEISIALPTIQLPHLVRYRRGPEMLTDTANASFQSGRPAAALHFAKPKEPEAKPQGAPPAKPGCDPCYPVGKAGSDEHVQRLERQVAQLSQLVETMASRERGYAENSPPEGTINPASYEMTSAPGRSEASPGQPRETQPTRRLVHNAARPAATAEMGQRRRNADPAYPGGANEADSASQEASGFSSVFD